LNADLRHCFARLDVDGVGSVVRATVSREAAGMPCGASIKLGDVDLVGCRVFIRQGKGSKDRYILFPASLRMTLASHMKANPKNARSYSRAASIAPILLAGSSNWSRNTKNWLA
jgi:hypothetical protein